MLKTEGTKTGKGEGRRKRRMKMEVMELLH